MHSHDADREGGGETICLQEPAKPEARLPPGAYIGGTYALGGAWLSLRVLRMTR